MTHPSKLDATAEIPADFTSHLAERLQLAPDAAQAHLESWLTHYTRPPSRVIDAATVQPVSEAASMQMSIG